ncbi:MAG TPA: DUF5597 domain-containing protein [Terracidiphilus sp.]|nr:DUF5597 domain-containing protein [Terracidiphilus sp.]
MRTPLNTLAVLCLVSVFLLIQTSSKVRAQSSAPHLEKRGITTQLIVDGQPFLVLSGELFNSSSSSLDYMKPIWPRMTAMGLNTVITPLTWELIEPAEGKFDFSLVDGLLAQARENHQKVIFLWLASWKNGMSSYAPVWVKQDTQRFPRVIERGEPVEILSPASANTEKADATAFAALMQHIKQVDSADHTVLMMQVENEVGVLGDSRDHSAAANKEFDGPVPAQLTAYLKDHRDTLYPELRELWEANGARTSGTWAQVFGDTTRADEIFMAWHYARFIQNVTAAGKAAYDLPMYVNTWLAGQDTAPGNYPSGGPQPRVVDVWRAAGSAIDIYSPDLYDPHFIEWCKRYHRDGNPLFMPETRGGSAGAANVFYAMGEEDGIGFSPFGIDWTPPENASGKQTENIHADPNGDLTASYHALASIMPQITAAQAAGTIHGFTLTQDHPAVDFTMQGYTLHVTLDEIFGNNATEGYGLIISEGKDQFLGLGKGFRVSFIPRSGPQVGIASIREGKMVNGKWISGRQLNGDEDDQGKGWRFDPRHLNLERVTLYRYQ